MTVSAQETLFRHVGNGVTTTFAYSCQVLQANDLYVYVDGVQITSGITKNGIGDLAGGSVTFATAPANGAAVILERTVALERTTDYQQNGDFLSGVVNLDFNRIWMAIQQVGTSLSTAMLFPKSDVDPITELPPAADRANLLLSFNELGNPITAAPVGGSATDLAIQLATSNGMTQIGYNRNVTGSEYQLGSKKFDQAVSVFDFMTEAQQDDVKAGTQLLDMTVPIQEALDYITNTRTSGLTTSGALSTSYTGTSQILLFPKGTYKVTAALNVGGYVEIRGESAIIQQATLTEDIFVCDTYLLKITGIQFVGGRHQIDIFNANIDSTMIQINYCQFLLARSYAINTRVTGGVYTHLSANLDIYECRFLDNNKVLNNCCDQAVMERCWIRMIKTNFTASTAAIQNRGANVGDPDALTRLRLRDCFMIPDVGTEGVDRVANVRWIDNYGSFTAENTRFGGESGGMSILWQIGAPNTVFPWTSTEAIFKNCFLFCGPDARTDSCVIGIQGQIPNRVVVHNCTGPVGRPIIANLSSLAIPAYMTAFEAASSRKAYEYFKIDIQDAQHDINAYAPARSIIPSDLYKYVVKGRKTKIARVAAQSMANAFVHNLVSFDTISYETVAGAFVLANPTEIVMPKGCGKIAVTIDLQMAVNGAAKTYFVAVVLPTTFTRVAGVVELRGINADSDLFNIKTELEGPPGTVWHVSVRHNGAAAIDMTACSVSITPLDYIG